MSNRDRHGFSLVTHRTTLGDISVGLELCESFVCLYLEDSSSGGSLTVVNVTDGSDIACGWFFRMFP